MLRFFYSESDREHEGRDEGHRFDSVSELISAIYPSALDSGISPERFWDLTIQEINDEIQSHQRTIEQKQKSEVDRLFVLSDAISTRVAYFFSDPKTRDQGMILQKWDAYPSVFSEEHEKADDTQKDEALEKFKEGRRKFASRWNSRFREDSNESGSSQTDSVDRGTDQSI